MGVSAPVAPCNDETHDSTQSGEQMYAHFGSMHEEYETHAENSGLRVVDLE
jgi:hypothetical protein